MYVPISFYALIFTLFAYIYRESAFRPISHSFPPPLLGTAFRTVSNNFGDVDTISRRTRAQLSLAGQDIEELSSFLNEDEDEIIERDFEIYKEFLQDFRISHGFGAENQKEDEFTAFHNDIDSIVQGTSTLPLDGSSPTNSRRRRPSSLVEKGQRRWKKQGRPRRDSSNNKRGLQRLRLFFFTLFFWAGPVCYFICCCRRGH